MKRQGTFVLIAMILVMLINLAPAPQESLAAIPSDVFFSEYIEGSSFNKALEIYNGTGASVDLTAGGYAVDVYSNGSPTVSQTVILSGSVAPDDVFVIAQYQANAAILAQTDQTTNLGLWNGNDAIALRKGAVILDVIGQIGYDPGSQWGTDLTSTADNTIIRKNTICSGDVDGSNAFDPALEWDGYAVDTFGYLGSHTANCGETMVPKINEFSASTTGTDVEYVEIFGSPNTDYSAYTVLGLEGDVGTSVGRIDNVFPIGTTDVNGLFLVSITVEPFLENGSISLLLVKNFSSSVGIDLDTNDDGDLEQFPWSEIADTVAVTDGGIGDITYGLVTLGPNYDGLVNLAPGGASRIPDGFDTESTTDWVRNDFDLAGIPGYPGTPVVGEALNTPGALNQLYSLPPVEAAPEVSATTPSSNATNVPTDSTIAITFSEPVTVSGTWFDITCTVSGAHTATVTDADPLYTLTPDSAFANSESCTVTIYAAQVEDDDLEDPPGMMVSDYFFTFSTAAKIEACGDPFTATYSIQGDGATTPLLGQELATEGIVVGDFQTNVSVSGSKNGFYIQDPTGDGNPSTSDGLFVYSTLVDVHPGDHVRVRGKAAEYTTGTGSLTQVSTVTQIWVCSTGNSLSPTQLSLPVASDFDYEDYEGMLVTYPQDLVISEYYNFDRYGEIVLTSRRHTTPTAEFEPGSPEYYQAVQDYLLDKITLDDGRVSQNPDPAIHPNGEVFDMDNLFRGGDLVTHVTGILDFYQSLYRVQPIQGADYTPANPRPVAPALEGDLQVASFNVLNYFLTIDTGLNICGPSGDMECRGANSEEELARQRAKILAALSDINADVYGLMEIQNDEDQSVADLVAGLNDIFGLGAYDYIATGYIGTDAIKQAIIYKVASVTPLGEFAILDSSVDARFLDDFNRPVLAQSFIDNLTGFTFTVAVNHLKSKGSECLEDPDLGDGQGNCNLTRTAAAEALVDWLANDPTGSGVSESLIIGDLNSYDKEDPIDAILEGPDDILGNGDDYTDMIYHSLGEYAYSYVFDGQTGYLDHALADPTLVDNVVGVTIWHINADEPDLIDYNMDFKADAQDLLFAEDAYRSSDHDPVIISLSLDQPYSAMDDSYETPFGMQLVVDAPGLLSNDSLVNPGDTLTVQLKTDVANGILSLSPDGTFTYTPEPGFSGTVTFVYELVSSVSGGVVAEATVTITVLEGNITFFPIVWTQ